MRPLSGGRGNDTSLARVRRLRAEGHSEKEIRRILLDDGSFMKARVSQLLTQTRPESSSSAGVAAAIAKTSLASSSTASSAAVSSCAHKKRKRALSTTPVYSCFKHLRHTPAVYDLDEETQAIHEEAVGMPDQMPIRGRKRKVRPADDEELREVAAAAEASAREAGETPFNAAVAAGEVRDQVRAERGGRSRTAASPIIVNADPGATPPGNQSDEEDDISVRTLYDNDPGATPDGGNCSEDYWSDAIGDEDITIMDCYALDRYYSIA